MSHKIGTAGGLPWPALRSCRGGGMGEEPVGLIGSDKEIMGKNVAHDATSIDQQPRNYESRQNKYNYIKFFLIIQGELVIFAKQQKN